MNKDNTKETAKEHSEKPRTVEGGSEETIPEDAVCQKAPEWAEHYRLQDEDEPCDDGRSGNINPSDQGEKK